MPDYGCIRVDYIAPPLTYALPTITDSKGRDWYYIEIPKLSKEIQDDLYTSEYASAGWLCARWNPVISALGLPEIKLFDPPKGQFELTRLITEFSRISRSKLGAKLAAIEDTEINVPIRLDEMQGGKKKKQSQAAIARAKLRRKIIRICDKCKEDGWRYYHSGQYSMNGRNYAKDIVSAAEYARGLLSEIDDFTLSGITTYIDSKRTEYESIYTDLEGFGGGTLTDIIDRIKSLEK